MTILGTRPEIIRLSLIIKLLDKHAEHVLVHTGQNYDPKLSDAFFSDLRLRKPDHHLSVRSTNFAGQASQILAKVDSILEREQPDRILILGDTNSGLASIVAARRRVPVFHLEAGNRCYDNRVPEELNRRIIDHSSDVLMPYTQRSADNLLAEGIRRERIYVIGNPICEVITSFSAEIGRSKVLRSLKLHGKSYFLCTMHRAENVDSPDRLRCHLAALTRLATEYGKPIVLSVHPRTSDRIRKAGIRLDPRKIRLEQPFGFFDFVHLEKQALGIVTDSGTVQEEACLLGIPNVTIRDVTERPETVEFGSNMLVGDSGELLVRGMKLAIENGSKWECPSEYKRVGVAATAVKIVLGYR